MTPDQAKALTAGQTIYHVSLKNADGTALRARVNGAVKMLKRDPGYFQVPMKHGLNQCFYLDGSNAHDWQTGESK
jgi:hypothetical protein